MNAVQLFEVKNRFFFPSVLCDLKHYLSCIISYTTWDSFMLSADTWCEEHGLQLSFREKFLLILYFKMTCCNSYVLWNI
jgi:hypothetical protein